VALSGCGPTVALAPGTASTTSRPAAAPTTSTAAASAAPTSPSVPAALVVLDPGHNGGNAGAPAQINRLVPAGGYLKPCNTVGAATNAGYPEHAFTFDVAQRAAALLRARGVTVVLTRQDDAGVGPCVDERAEAANAAGAALAVSIHADGAAAGVRGFHVIEPAPAPDKGNVAVLGASDTAALDLRAAFAAATGEPPATYPGSLVSAGLTRRDDLAGLNLARVPAVFIECANMRNATDAAAVTSAAWRQQAAQGIADGVLAFVAGR
jgi:N-acetylmuramoyl-L-alanine amidase